MSAALCLVESQIRLPDYNLDSSIRDRVIARMVKNMSIDEDVARRAFDGAIQFLRACAVPEGRRLAPSHLADEAWHTFLLYSKPYTDFCQSMGVDYLHHDPCDLPGSMEPGTYARTREYLCGLYADLDTEIWPEDGERDWGHAQGCCNSDHGQRSSCRCGGG
ncbi:hypothetical protein COV06_01160 [Candidatus Uhrbacteria bacterium CG10_big_fil_rev_8_21_14_0_10_50_16]|uniref:Uncharacterized protein n=1 Tax=Candidatus Uhrbacteria bacterium CG10_big_fil_rev_8_21_14_0_10_50_16 TaxID=1975039 RepID=A0A2H0RN65_9BACT|nr:MAG: hypothetical protein COV06_01160 [Candidatus Uhrbacteria bacterium CG10_big_fil_rev_8_21_14_0_10_50_16]